MITKDYHVHSDFSDGKFTPEEMVLSAISMGMTELGFSDHSSMNMDTSWCMPKEKYGAYRSEIARIKEKYAGKISILCGIERDFDSDDRDEKFDYVIGSVHMLYKNETWFGVDSSAKVTAGAIETLYGGDAYALCEDYYEKLCHLGDLKPDIIGHFDLLTKFDEKKEIFIKN